MQNPAKKLLKQPKLQEQKMPKNTKTSKDSGNPQQLLYKVPCPCLLVFTRFLKIMQQIIEAISDMDIPRVSFSPQ